MEINVDLMQCDEIATSRTAHQTVIKIGSLIWWRLFLHFRLSDIKLNISDSWVEEEIQIEECQLLSLFFFLTFQRTHITFRSVL